jgi:hypothetical protein
MCKPQVCKPPRSWTLLGKRLLPGAGHLSCPYRLAAHHRREAVCLLVAKDASR